MDNISAKISKYLYPNANIINGGYENTELQNEAYDLAIGNIPFGDFKIYDTERDRKYTIHDYFFVKTLDKVKSNGIIAFINIIRNYG